MSMQGGEEEHGYLGMSQDALGQLKHLKTARARWPWPDVGGANTQNMREPSAHMIDSELVGDLHGADVDGRRGQAVVLEP